MGITYSFADEQRAVKIFTEIAKKAVSKVTTAYNNPIKQWDKFRHAKLKTVIFEIIESVVQRNLKAIIKASQTRPIILKEMEDLRELKKSVRHDLSTGIRSARNKKKKIEEEIEALKDKHKQLLSSSSFEPNAYGSIPPVFCMATVYAPEIPAVSGIYFIWEDGIVAYVGQSINLNRRVRIGGHHAIKDGDWVSFVEVEKKHLNFAESYYIGISRPVRNFGGCVA